MQMLAWPDEFCARLADTGHYVVRFDNRDCGLSTHLDSVAAPDPARVLLRRETAPYSIEEMAADTLGLIDALGLNRVDLVGASMGGFIAQAAALASPDRLRSLTLLMTSTGSRRVGYPSPKVARRLLRRRSVGDRDAAIAMAVSVFRLIGSPGYVFDEEYLQRLAGRSYDRAYDPKGYLRQLAACLVQQDRTPRLRELSGARTRDSRPARSAGVAQRRTSSGARHSGCTIRRLLRHGPRPAAGTAVGDCERDRASGRRHGPRFARPVVATHRAGPRDAEWATPQARW
jgi:pimeloyl-ACP methyl ester carboxylesterase